MKWKQSTKISLPMMAVLLLIAACVPEPQPLPTAAQFPTETLTPEASPTPVASVEIAVASSADATDRPRPDELMIGVDVVPTLESDVLAGLVAGKLTQTVTAPEASPTVVVIPANTTTAAPGGASSRIEGDTVAVASTPQAVEVLSPPRPDFILRFTAGSENFDREICIAVNEGALWEEGNQAADLHSHIEENTVITVNDEVAELDDNMVTVSTFSVTNVLDTADLDAESPGVLGSFSDISFCVDVSDLAPGEYSGAIETSTLSGTPRSYTWAFVVR